jgi:hypothetical protein
VSATPPNSSADSPSNPTPGPPEGQRGGPRGGQRQLARWTMPEASVGASSSLSPEAVLRARKRARLGLVLIAVGVVGILWGVFYVLAALPTAEKLDFAHRMTDYQARKSVHETFPGGLVRALVGLGVALWGGRLHAKALRELGSN